VTKKELFKKITELKGKKIVTLQSGEGSWSMILQEGPESQKNKANRIQFEDKFFQAQNAAVIIRQILPIKYTIKNDLGENIEVPYRNLFGVYVEDGECLPIEEGQLKMAYSYDAETGNSIEAEEGVFYRMLSDDSAHIG
jgi:hypothetical protein